MCCGGGGGGGGGGGAAYTRGRGCLIIGCIFRLLVGGPWRGAGRGGAYKPWFTVYRPRAELP